MYRVRAINLQDTHDLESLTATTGTTQACLPKTPASIHQWIKCSIDSFNHKISQSDGHLMQDNKPERHYVWGLEYIDNKDKRIVGCIAVEAITGAPEPFYSYRRETLINASYRLKVKQDIPVLYQSHELANYSHIYAFTVDKTHRTQDNLCLLLQAILLYISEYPNRFSNKLLVEFPGFKDERGLSPLWQDLGQHFFQMNLEQACWHASQEDKALIAQLMPNHPLYENLLNETAQNTLGVPQQDLLDYFEVFKQEGFLPSNHIDIFDGGPCLICNTQQSWSIQQSARVKFGRQTEFTKPHIVADISAHKPMTIRATNLADTEALKLDNDQWLRSVEQLRLTDPNQSNSFN